MLAHMVVITLTLSLTILVMSCAAVLVKLHLVR